jgi:UDP-N-acetylmuramoyl-L-alanyl-D-glutamate--2,6-diaminopimelate ligase
VHALLHGSKLSCRRSETHCRIVVCGGVFTNITHDHLDYHKTFAEYIKAKKSFFDSLKADAFALINADDKNGLMMLQNTKAKKYTYSLRSMSDYKCKLIENHFSGLILNLDGQEVHCKLVGSFNAYNLTAAYATAMLMGEEKMNVLLELSRLNPWKGGLITSHRKRKSLPSLIMHTLLTPCKMYWPPFTM